MVVDFRRQQVSWYTLQNLWRGSLVSDTSTYTLLMISVGHSTHLAKQYHTLTSSDSYGNSRSHSSSRILSTPQLKRIIQQAAHHCLAWPKTSPKQPLRSPDISSAKMRLRAQNILKDAACPSNELLSLLKSDRCLWRYKAKHNDWKYFSPETIHILKTPNAHNHIATLYCDYLCR